MYTPELLAEFHLQKNGLIFDRDFRQRGVEVFELVNVLSLDDVYLDVDILFQSRIVAFELQQLGSPLQNAAIWFGRDVWRRNRCAWAEAVAFRLFLGDVFRWDAFLLALVVLFFVPEH